MPICQQTTNSAQMQSKTVKVNIDVTVFLLLKNCSHFYSWLFLNSIIPSALYHKLYFKKKFFSGWSENDCPEFLLMKNCSHFLRQQI